MGKYIMYIFIFRKKQSWIELVTNSYNDRKHVIYM